MMTHDEMIAVIQAHKVGKEIEFRDQRYTEFKEWVQCREPKWNFLHCDYRIKPEPLVLWVSMKEDNDVYDASTDKHAVESTMLCTKSKLTLKKFVEVTE